MRLITESDSLITRDDLAAFEHVDTVFDQMYQVAENKSYLLPVETKQRYSRSLNTFTLEPNNHAH